jgi:ABC-2 type transport system ATP-binding protein
MTYVLEAKHVTVRYRNQRGIQDISLNLKQGEIFGLVGPNGAGKTTFLKAVSGLLQFKIGEVLIKGQSIQTNYEQAMQHMGCLIESPALYEELTAHRNLLLHSRLYQHVHEQQIEAVLDQVGLAHARLEKVKNFSQGMKQRLGIASALLSTPDFIVLDEPTNGLDVDGVIQFKELIKELSANSQQTVLISSHQMFELESLCHRVGIISNGELICTEETSHIQAMNKTLEQWYIEQIRIQKDGVSNV